jgi:hypothetical protein
MTINGFLKDADCAIGRTKLLQSFSDLIIVRFFASISQLKNSRFSGCLVE